MPRPGEVIAWGRAQSVAADRELGLLEQGRPVEVGTSAASGPATPDGLSSSSWSPDSAKKTRPRPERAIAPRHIGHGSQRVQRRLARDVRGQLTPRPAGELSSGVGRDVALAEDRVAILGEHLAIRARQQRAERHVTGRARGGGELDRAPEVALVRFAHVRLLPPHRQAAWMSTTPAAGRRRRRAAAQRSAGAAGAGARSGRRAPKRLLAPDGQGDRRRRADLRDQREDGRDVDAPARPPSQPHQGIRAKAERGRGASAIDSETARSTAMPAWRR